MYFYLQVKMLLNENRELVINKEKLVVISKRYQTDNKT